MNATPKSLLSKLVVLGLSLLTASVLAQSPASTATRFDIARQGNRLIINGTSTVHDWSVKGTRLLGKAIFHSQADSQDNPWKWLSPSEKDPRILVKIPVRSLKGDSDRMNEAMYDAFRAQKNPYIIYRLDKIWDAQMVTPSKAVAKASGRLTMAGKTRKIRVKIHIARPHDGRLEIRGHQQFDMRDFDIEPPTAMFGLLKADPHVDVSFIWELEKR